MQGLAELLIQQVPRVRASNTQKSHCSDPKGRTNVTRTETKQKNNYQQ